MALQRVLRGTRFWSLAVFAFLAICLVFSGEPSKAQQNEAQQTKLRGAQQVRVGGYTRHRFNATVLRPSDHLIIVCGHAVTVVEDLSNVDEDASWYLLPYQRGQGLPATFVAHIARGVKGTTALK